MAGECLRSWSNSFRGQIDEKGNFTLAAVRDCNRLARNLWRPRDGTLRPLNQYDLNAALIGARRQSLYREMPARIRIRAAASRVRTSGLTAAAHLNAVISQAATLNIDGTADYPGTVRDQ